MVKIALLIYIIAAPTLAGIAMVVMLTIGADTTYPIVGSVTVGALLAIPIAWYVAKQISSIKGLVKPG